MQEVYYLTQVATMLKNRKSLAANFANSHEFPFEFAKKIF